MEYVLFSAIGDSDPIRGDFDGPMLHIVRNYRPTAVYLLFTADMARKEESTGCCSKAIAYIAPDCTIIPIKTNIENPSDFDAFHELLAATINRIREQHPKAEILLNISSATPQIKSAMCLEVVTHREFLRPIQVSNPENKSGRNMGHFDPYKNDIVAEMENVFENLPEALNRCHEPNLIGFKKSMIKRQIRALAESYGYKGAYDLAQENAALLTPKLILLLRHAYYRSLPDNKKADDAARELKMHYELYPVQNNPAGLFCEYCIVAKQRKAKRELTDYVLRLVAITEDLLKYEIGNTIAGWERITGHESPKMDKSKRSQRPTTKDKRNKSKSLKLNKSKAEAAYPGLIGFVEKEQSIMVNDRARVDFRMLESIAKFLNINGYEKLCTIRDMRNKSAHSLESITESSLKAVGTSPNELQAAIEALITRNFGKAVANSKDAIFNIFEKINNMIYNELDAVQ